MCLVGAESLGGFGGGVEGQGAVDQWPDSAVGDSGQQVFTSSLFTGTRSNAQRTRT